MQFIADNVGLIGLAFLVIDFAGIVVLMMDSNHDESGIVIPALLVVMFAGGFLCLMFHVGAFRSPVYEPNPSFLTWCEKNGGFSAGSSSYLGNYCTLPSGQVVNGNY